MISLRLQTTTGLYIGARDVYIVQLKGTLFGPRLVKFAQTEIRALEDTPSPARKREQAIAQAIKRIVQENNILSRQMVVALPGKDALIRYFQMPRIPQAEWESAVRFEAKKYIPFKIEELMWDFHIVLSRVKGAKMNVSFAAAKKEVVQSYLSILKQAGITPLALEPAPFSLLRLLTLTNQMAKGKTTAIVDIDYGLADINIAKDRICYLTRDVSLPPEEVFSSLVSEIRMSLDYYGKLFPTEAVRKILLCGEVELDDWDEKLAKELKVSVETVKLVKAVRLEKALPLPSVNMGIAVGLTLSSFAKVATEVNLCKVREAAQLKPTVAVIKKAFEFTPQIRLATFRAVTVSCIGLLLLYLLMTYRISRQNKELQRTLSLRPAIGLASDFFSYSYAKMEEIKQDKQAKLATCKVIIDKRVFWTTKFNELPKIVPAQIWLTNLSLNDKIFKGKRLGREWTIGGVALQKDPMQEIGLVTQFASNLKNNEEFFRGFDKISLDSIASAELEGVAVKNFTISCSTQ